MENKREKITKFEEQKLYEEVEGICPLCTKPLHHKKADKMFGNYDKAHIYPLNATEEQEKILKNEKKLSDDINDIRNLILLCKSCHFEFDNPRTLEGYRKLYSLKNSLIERSSLKNVYSLFGLEDELRVVLNKLNIIDIDDSPELKYDAKKVEEKSDETMPKLLKKRIKNDVVDYFIFIKEMFVEIDKLSPRKFDTMATQIRAFYLKCSQTSNNQEIIYNSIVDWIYNKTEKYSKRACEVIVAFFIQDCEVFK